MRCGLEKVKLSLFYKIQFALFLTKRLLINESTPLFSIALNRGVDSLQT